MTGFQLKVFFCFKFWPSVKCCKVETLQWKTNSKSYVAYGRVHYYDTVDSKRNRCWASAYLHHHCRLMVVALLNSVNDHGVTFAVWDRSK